MKKKTISLMLGTVLFCACQPGQEKTTVSGTLQDVANDTLFVMYTPVNQRSQLEVDTLVAQSGQFTYDVACDSIPLELAIYHSGAPETEEGEMNSQINLLVFPEENITLTGSMKDHQVEGSTFFTA